jgi:biopolymer transport protein TolR
MLAPAGSELAKTRWTMGMFVGGKRGVVSEMNVVPLIDILLVLLVIFMIIPVHNVGLDTQLPEPSAQPPGTPPPDVVVVQVLADGTLRINQEPVTWDRLGGRIEEVFKQRATRIAFIRGDGPVEFGVVAKVIDVMHASGIASVGLLTPGLEKGL